MKEEPGIIAYFRAHRKPALLSLAVSSLLSLVFISNNYWSTEDFTFHNELFDGSFNSTFIRTCIYDGKYTLYFLFHILRSLHLHDTIALSFLYLLLFRVQLIALGLMLLRHCKINLPPPALVLCLCLLSFYPYLVEPVIYKHYFGFQSASFCYFFSVWAVLLLRERRVSPALPVLLLVISFGMYQTMANMAICVLTTLTFTDLLGRKNQDAKPVLRSFFVNLGFIAIAGIAYLGFTKLFTHFYMDEQVSRISFIHNGEQVMSVFRSVGLALARTLYQAAGDYNLTDRIMFLAILGLIITLSVKRSWLAVLFFVLSLLSNFAIFFLINPEAGSILSRTLTSFAFFSFILIVFSWSAYRDRLQVYKAHYIIAVVMLISYVSVWYTVVGNNIINKKRDMMLAAAILQEIYEVNGYRSMKLFYQVGSERIYDLENKKNPLLAAQTNFSSYNNDQNFPHQLLKFVSGIDLQRLTDPATQQQLLREHPYDRLKVKGKRFNIVAVNGCIIVYL